MKTEWKEPWASALESGRFNQGRGRLNEQDRYCCLGVLCEITGIDYSGQAGYPPEKLPEVTGLSGDDIEIFVSLNDGCLTFLERTSIGGEPEGYEQGSGMSFAGIAKYIRERL